MANRSVLAHRPPRGDERLRGRAGVVGVKQDDERDDLVVDPFRVVVTEVSRQLADQLTKRPDFPEPLTRLASGAIWSGASVRRWLAAWERKSGRPKASDG